MAKSRMTGTLAAGLLAAPGVAQQPPTDAAAFDRYTELTSVATDCRARPHEEILVCGRRAADRYRPPLIGYDKGDPRGESVSGERNRFASAPELPCGVGAILKNCGMVGVHVGVALDGGPLRAREPAD